MSLAKAITEVFSTRVQGDFVAFEYSQMETAGKSRAMLRTTTAMDCPHCNVRVPANHQHTCALRGGNWTRRDTPL